MTCPDCKGTGYVTLLTTREPCKACAEKLQPITPEIAAGFAAVELLQRVAITGCTLSGGIYNGMIVKP